MHKSLFSCSCGSCERRETLCDGGDFNGRRARAEASSDHLSPTIRLIMRSPPWSSASPGIWHPRTEHWGIVGRSRFSNKLLNWPFARRQPWRHAAPLPVDWPATYMAFRDRERSRTGCRRVASSQRLYSANEQHVFKHCEGTNILFIATLIPSLGIFFFCLHCQLISPLGRCDSAIRRRAKPAWPLLLLLLVGPFRPFACCLERLLTTSVFFTPPKRMSISLTDRWMDGPRVLASSSPAAEAMIYSPSRFCANDQSQFHNNTITARDININGVGIRTWAIRGYHSPFSCLQSI